MNLSGATRLAAVIGDPIRHSRSPAIFNTAFAAYVFPRIAAPTLAVTGWTVKNRAATKIKKFIYASMRKNSFASYTEKHTCT